MRARREGRKQSPIRVAVRLVDSVVGKVSEGGTLLKRLVEKSMKGRARLVHQLYSSDLSLSVCEESSIFRRLVMFFATNNNTAAL